MAQPKKPQTPTPTTKAVGAAQSTGGKANSAGRDSANVVMELVRTLAPRVPISQAALVLFIAVVSWALIASLPSVKDAVTADILILCVALVWVLGLILLAFRFHTRPRAADAVIANNLADAGRVAESLPTSEPDYRAEIRDIAENR